MCCTVSHDRAAGILSLLEEAHGWRSGEEISSLLGISRAAVGKHVAALRVDGHAIEAAPRRGYKLLAKRDVINPEALAADLRTVCIGKKGWHILGETTSTNSDAIKLAAEGSPEGVVVLAERQTRGRGRKGNTWCSAPRGLQFSLILRPDIRHCRSDLLTSLAMRAVQGAIQEYTGIKAEGKAPNDVFVKMRKVAGILVETGFRGDEPEWAVVGIGCNVNALPGDFPPELRPRITSLLEENGRPLSRSAILQCILELFESYYRQL